MAPREGKLRVAFVVGEFPTVSETFLINQVADLMDSGVEVDVFAFALGEQKDISERYYRYRMPERTHSLQRSRLTARTLGALVANGLRMLANPGTLARVLRQSWKDRSLDPLFATLPLVGRRFDLVHCHFGDVANRYLSIRDLLRSEVPFATTFYGHDVSRVFRAAPENVYDRLKALCPRFFVMSEDMKRRVVERGFSAEKVVVLPVSIDVESYPFSQRTIAEGAPVELISVARFVEKKGLDDLLRALSLVNARTRTPFHCSIVGSGPMEAELRSLRASLRLESAVEFVGSLPVEEVIGRFPGSHLLVQPSKTARDGDME